MVDDDEHIKAFWRFVDDTNKLVEDAINAGLTCGEITNTLELHANAARDFFESLEEKKKAVNEDLDSRS